MQQKVVGTHTRTRCTHANPEINLFSVTVFSFTAVSINVSFAGLICNLIKSHQHRSRDLFSCFTGITCSEPGKHGHVRQKLKRHILQLERA